MLVCGIVSVRMAVLCCAVTRCCRVFVFVGLLGEVGFVWTYFELLFDTRDVYSCMHNILSLAKD